MVFDTSLLNTQQCKVCIKSKVEQSRERSSAPLHLGVVAIEKRAFLSPSTTVANFTLLTTLEQGMNSLILPAMGKIIPLPSFYENNFGIKYVTKIEMPLNK